MRDDFKICVVSGWYMDSQGHNNKEVADELESPDWLNGYWRPYIERFVIPDHYFIYSSLCQIMPVWDNRVRSEIIIGHTPAAIQDHRHDWWASFALGLQYAYMNELNAVYVEQDCLVYGLDKALDWAKDKNLCYGFGENASYCPGWAANSFVWVKWSFIPQILAQINSQKMHLATNFYGEVIWQNNFKDYATYWPFGYDRKRPINWDDKVMYAQQITSDDLRHFMLK